MWEVGDKHKRYFPIAGSLSTHLQWPWLCRVQNWEVRTWFRSSMWLAGTQYLEPSARTVLARNWMCEPGRNWTRHSQVGMNILASVNHKGKSMSPIKVVFKLLNPWGMFSMQWLRYLPPMMDVWVWLLALLLMCLAPNAYPGEQQVMAQNTWVAPLLGKPMFNSGFLTLAWLDPGYCGHLGNESVDNRSLS